MAAAAATAAAAMAMAMVEEEEMASRSSQNSKEVKNSKSVLMSQKLLLSALRKFMKIEDVLDGAMAEAPLPAHAAPQPRRGDAQPTVAPAPQLWQAAAQQPPMLEKRLEVEIAALAGEHPAERLEVATKREK